MNKPEEQKTCLQKTYIQAGKHYVKICNSRQRIPSNDLFLHLNPINVPFLDISLIDLRKLELLSLCLRNRCICLCSIKNGLHDFVLCLFTVACPAVTEVASPSSKCSTVSFQPVFGMSPPSLSGSWKVHLQQNQVPSALSCAN